MRTTTKYLKLRKKKGFKLNETNGEEIQNVNSIFEGDVNDFFLEFNIQDKSTRNIKVFEFEVIKVGNFNQIFNSFNKRLHYLSFTRSQICMLCKREMNLIDINGYSHLFLFEFKIKYFVAEVYMKRHRLNIYVHPLSSDRSWHPGYERKFFIPQH